MKQFKGKVISDKMAKTATVLVMHQSMNTLYQKAIKKTKKYHVHNELKAKMGDKVVFVECKPISKTKKWKIIKII